MGKMKELEIAVQEWAEEKGLIFEGNEEAQVQKFLEEADEFADEVYMGNREKVIMEGGDVLVTMCIQAKLQGTSLEEMLQSAYDKISKRKGKTVNGTFVKEASA